MTRLSATCPRAGRLSRARASARRLALATTVACGLGSLAVSSSFAGTVLKGRVALPVGAAARATQVGKFREALSPADVVVFVTTMPGTRDKLAGRGEHRDIVLSGDRFEPRVSAVTTRSRVRFRNRDRVFHNVFSVSPAGRFELGSLAPGKDRETRFDHPGVINLFCQLHPAAAGFVVVCPNWFHTRPKPTGEYVLPPLPRGEYLVHAWHPVLGEIQRPVQVSGRNVVTFDLGF